MPVAEKQRQQAQPNGMTIIPLSINGMDSAGDASMVPDPHTILLRNHLLRPNRVDSRPPAVYDNLMSVMGLSTWEDLTNQQTRMIALDATKLYLKSASGETWDAGHSGVTGNRFTDGVSYRGKWYGMLDFGDGTPTSALSWDGTTLSSAPFNSTIVSRAIAAYNDRLYFAYPRVTTTNLAAAPLAYDWTGAPPGYPYLNVTSKVVTLSTGVIVGRLYPTSTAVNGSSAGPGQIFTVAANANPLPFTWHFEARGLDPSYRVPVTLQWLLQNGRSFSTAYAVGDIITVNVTVPIIYRAIVAGTSSGGTPTFSEPFGTNTVDGTVTWQSEQSAFIAGKEYDIPSATDSANFFTYISTCTVPARTNQVALWPVLAFWNTARTALTTLAPIEYSLKDGIADGDARKQNHGSQWTAGNFDYPFFNKESVYFNTFDLESLIWSEIADPKTIRGANNYQPKEEAGLPTALKVVGGRLIMFKRRAFWVFQGQDNVDIPIIAEGPATIGAGCLGPRAVGTMEDEIFWIGENEAYRMRIGNYPRPLAGEAMREEIFNKGANWVESQSTYKMPLLTVDKKNREVWLYTQKGFLYCYHMADEDIPGVYRPYTPEKGMWTKHDINGQEIRAMSWNAATGELELSIGGGGLVRLDPTATPAKDQQDNTANTYNATMDIIFKPIELQAPRYDAMLQWIALYHLATASQTGQTLTAYLSFDRGLTYPKSIQVQFDPTVTRIPIPIFQTAPSITIKISYVGKIGAAIWSISRAEAALQVKRGEYPQAQPTVLASAL